MVFTDLAQPYNESIKKKRLGAVWSLIQSAYVLRITGVQIFFWAIRISVDPTKTYGNLKVHNAWKNNLQTTNF